MLFDRGEITISVAELRELLAAYEDDELVVMSGGEDGEGEFVIFSIGEEYSVSA